MKFTVYFDPPYWVGVLEEERDGQLVAARHVFGAEPSTQQIYDFVLHELDDLRAALDTGVPIEAGEASRRVNPKRRLREVRRALAEQGVTSKAHEALREQFEQHKQQRHEESKAERDAHRAHKRRVKEEKARQRHRGR